MQSNLSTPNCETFARLLAKQYETLFVSDSNFAYAKQTNTPQSLADKMTAGLATGSANKDSRAIKAVCEELGIKHTYAAIAAYLKATP